MAIRLGTNSDDDLFGTASNDVIFGYNAKISVQVGSDGSDIMLGKAGNDLLVDGALDGSLNPDDTLSGGDGNDYILAESGADTIDAGTGNDVVLVVQYSGSNGGVKDAPAGSKLLGADGGRGTDYLLYVMSGGYALDFTMGSKLNTTLYTGTKITSFETGMIIGGGLRDHLTASHWTLDAITNFAIKSTFANYHTQISNPTLQSTVDGIGKAFAAITQFQGFLGGYGGDYLTVALDAKTTKIGRGVLLSGGSGDDNIDLSLSQGAIKSLMVNNGLFKASDDKGKLVDTPIITIDAGEDYFGHDVDTFVFTLPQTLTQGITLGLPDSKGVTSVTAGGKLLEKIQGFEAYQLHLGAGADTVTTGNLADSIQGFAGNDKINSGDGNDTITGGLGADTVDGGLGTDLALFTKASTINLANPNAGAGEAKGDRYVSVERFLLSNQDDTFVGYLRPEAVDGGNGNDKLKGGGGKDTLIGGAGNDILTGGGDADIFRFLSPTTDGIDKVTDFVHGVDKISINLNTFRLAFINVIASADPKPVVPFEPVFLFDTHSGALSFDADGAGGAAASQFVTLVGVKTLDANDFEFYHPTGTDHF